MENKEKSKMITGQSSGSGSQRGGGCVCFDQYRIKNIIVEEGKSEIYVASQKVYKKRLYQKEN